MLRIVPLGRAGGDEELRDLIVVAIWPDRGVGWSAERVEQECDLFILDQSPHLLDRLRRTVAVVEADEIDLAAVDPALFVDHLEIGGLGAADDAIGRGRAAVGHGLPDLDLGVGDAGALSARAEPAVAAKAAAAALDFRNVRRLIIATFPFLRNARRRSRRRRLQLSPAGRERVRAQALSPPPAPRRPLRLAPRPLPE